MFSHDSNRQHPPRMASIQLATALALDGQITAAESELKQYLQRYEPTDSIWDLYFRLLYLQTRMRDVISLFEQKLSRPPQTLTDARFLLKAEFVPQDPVETRATLEDIRRASGRRQRSSGDGRRNPPRRRGVHKSRPIAPIRDGTS